jgi:hypothetical protein
MKIVGYSVFKYPKLLQCHLYLLSVRWGLLLLFSFNSRESYAAVATHIWICGSYFEVHFLMMHQSSGVNPYVLPTVFPL